MATTVRMAWESSAASIREVVETSLPDAAYILETVCAAQRDGRAPTREQQAAITESSRLLMLLLERVGSDSIREVKWALEAMDEPAAVELEIDPKPTPEPTLKATPTLSSAVLVMRGAATVRTCVEANQRYSVSAIDAFCTTVVGKRALSVNESVAREELEQVLEVLLADTGFASTSFVESVVVVAKVDDTVPIVSVPIAMAPVPCGILAGPVVDLAVDAVVEQLVDSAVEPLVEPLVEQLLVAVDVVQHDAIEPVGDTDDDRQEIKGGNDDVNVNVNGRAQLKSSIPMAREGGSSRTARTKSASSCVLKRSQRAPQQPAGRPAKTPPQQQLRRSVQKQQLRALPPAATTSTSISPTRNPKAKPATGPSFGVTSRRPQQQLTQLPEHKQESRQQKHKGPTDAMPARDRVSTMRSRSSPMIQRQLVSNAQRKTLPRSVQLATASAADVSTDRKRTTTSATTATITNARSSTASSWGAVAPRLSAARSVPQPSRWR